MATTKQAIIDAIKACGPCSRGHLVREVAEQATDGAQFAKELASLLNDGTLESRVDGDGVEWYAEGEIQRGVDGVLFRLHAERPEPIDCESCGEPAKHEPTKGNGGSDAFLCDACHQKGVAESEAQAKPKSPQLDRAIEIREAARFEYEREMVGSYATIIEIFERDAMANVRTPSQVYSFAFGKQANDIKGNIEAMQNAARKVRAVDAELQVLRTIKSEIGS